MFKTVEDIQKAGQNQIEAATAAAAAVSRGLQQIAGEASAYAKRSIEDGSSATTRLLGARTFDGAARVQAEYAKAAFESLVTQAGRMSALMMSVGQDAAKPFEAVAPFDLGGKLARR